MDTGYDTGYTSVEFVGGPADGFTLPMLGSVKQVTIDGVVYIQSLDKAMVFTPSGLSTEDARARTGRATRATFNRDKAPA